MFERRRRATLAFICKAYVVVEHAPAPSNRNPDPPQRTSRTVSSIAAQVTRPSQTPAHAAIHARANAVPIAASHTARVAEVCSDASRRLAPRSLARRAAKVGAPVPQASPVATQDPARIEPHGGARPILLHAPAARKRSASAAAGASVPLSPSAPLRARSGSCSAGGEMNEKNKPSMHVNQRFCTFVREYVDNLPAPRAFRCPAFQSGSCREERPEAPMWKAPACRPYNGRTGREEPCAHASA